MSWPSVTAGQNLLAAQYNLLVTAMQTWGGAVNGGGFALTGVASIAVTGAITASNLVPFVASGASHAAGFVPDPGASAGSTKFLREDATFAVPAFSAPVTSVFTRTGAIAAVSGDYSFSLISGSATVAQLPTGIPNANLANASVTVTAGTGLTGGGAVALGASVTLNVGTAPLATSLAAGALGSVPYQSAAGVSAFLAGNTTAAKQYLIQTGTGSVSAAPVWAAIAAVDIPTLNQSTTGNAANVTGIVAIANGGTGAASFLAAGLPALAAGNTFTGLQGFVANVFIFNANSNPATVSSNFSSPTLTIQSSYWTGAASASDFWTLQNVLGTGANPTTTLTVGHSGSAGAAVVSLPATSITSTLGVTGAATLTGGVFTSAIGNAVYLTRPSTFAANGVNWSLAIQNATASDNLTMGQSSTTYTTGGVLGWVGNSMAYLYFPTELRIGTGVGATPLLDLTSGAVSIGGTLTVTGAVTGALGGWLTWTPTVTPTGSMTATSLSILSAQYLRVGPVVHFTMRLTYTLGGTAATILKISLPLVQTGDYSSLTAYIAAPTNYSVGVAYTNSGAGDLTLYTNGGAIHTLGANTIFISGSYRCA